MKLSSLKSFCFLLIIVSIFFAESAFALPPGEPSKPQAETRQERQPPSTTTQAQDTKASTEFFANATYDRFEPVTEQEPLFDESSLGESSVSAASNNTTIDAGAITIIQSTFLENLKKAFSSVAGYALNLLYLFAIMEIVVFGFVWALQRDVGWDKLFFKIIKIGLIFFVIQNYTWLLDTIMQSFAQIAGVVINNTAAAKYVFNPAKIWQYGYDPGVKLLQLATVGNNYGLAMTQVSLGMGILLVFGMLGIQMILQMISFYVVSLGALILLPFGAFALGRGMLDRAVQAVFQAGIRLMSLIIVIGIAVVVWDGFDLTMEVTKINVGQSLGLFFTALLFCSLAFYLPKVLSQAVGSFGNDFFDGASSAPVVVNESGAASVVTTDAGGTSDMRAATAIEAPGAGGGGYVGGGEVGAAAAAPVSVNVSPAGGSMEAKMARDTLIQASYLSKSVSESTVKKIKEAVLNAVKDKK